MESRPLTVIFRDEDLVAVAKPAGLVTHPTRQCADGTSLMQLLRDQLGRWVYPAHRLDRATSGVMVLGLSAEAARGLTDALAARAARKTYLAVTRGWCPDEGLVDKPLPANGDGPLQEAATSFRTLARAERPWPVRPYASARYSLVAATPHTGRTHQLRLHLRALNHPIVGDTKHGDGAHNAAWAERLGVRRLLLHAWRLELPHPRTGAPLALVAPPPPEFIKALEIFGEFSLPLETAPPPA